MEGDKKLETLEEEMKLMKGELKQSLASVRDYLLNMELPSSEFSTILAALGDGNDQKITMRGSFTNNKERPKPPEDEIEEQPVDSSQEESLEETESPGEGASNPEESFETDSEMLPAGESLGQDENLDENGEPLLENEDGTSGGSYETQYPESEIPAEEEPQMAYEKMKAEADLSVPKVNLLANLISWVAKAKKDIGDEQLATFLEVYGISGHLSPEMKDIVMHLAEITSGRDEDTNTAEVWSQSMLALHGILTGGDAPVYAVRPPWNGGNGGKPVETKIVEPVAKKPKNKSPKLKLVFPNGDGEEKEFSLDLSSEDNGKEP